VHGAATCSGAQHAGADLHLTARVAGGDELGAGRPDVGELGLEDEAGDLRLQ